MMISLPNLSSTHSSLYILPHKSQIKTKKQGSDIATGSPNNSYDTKKRGKGTGIHFPSSLFVSV